MRILTGTGTLVGTGGKALLLPLLLELIPIVPTLPASLNAPSPTPPSTSIPFPLPSGMNVDSGTSLGLGGRAGGEELNKFA